ncbi:HEAT repeat domain-containing protein [Rhodopirellula sallentina]|uniref:PBS lyase HEAT domain protein repeat-containing protein n=1 Tax=Rhodopirellula sallentina SM41 TaxID=1263870 RepID=M5TUM7_9BACT|nr:HEAT repeat domain-containing protein [Rhodopirellula sallentina]EMI52897.1 PBS lyase HEAT domain protein repeat-containing protein [Rhodopirellula sallentina SM41]
MNTIDNWVADLASDDGVIREQARNRLVAKRGPDVVRALVGELVDPRKRVRWEAAKALTEIGDPVAALPLVHAMTDSDDEVAWLAAEGIASLGDVGLSAALSGIAKDCKSLEYCKVAHHCLKGFRKLDLHEEIIAPVMSALEGFEPKLSAPVAAYRALRELKVGVVAR